MEDMSEAMEKLINIENYFDNKLRQLSSRYLEGLSLGFRQREAEYRWLTNVACDILLKADKIKSQEYGKIWTRRKILIKRVDAMLDELKWAKERFDRQEKEQGGVESYPPRSWKHQEALDSELPRGISDDIRRRASQSPLAASFDERGSTRRALISTSESSSDDDVTYEPPRTNARFTTVTKKFRFDEKRAPLESSSDDDVIYQPPRQKIRMKSGKSRHKQRSPDNDVVFEPPLPNTSSKDVTRNRTDSTRPRPREPYSHNNTIYIPAPPRSGINWKTPRPKR
jgi:hypothetical protein